MYKLVRYLFYKYYRMMILLTDGESAPFTALSLVSSLTLFNIFNIFLIFTSNDIIKNLFFIQNKFYGLIIAFLNFLIHYFLLYHKKKYLSIIHEFKSENERNRVYGNLMVVIYTFISISLLFLILKLKYI